MHNKRKINVSLCRPRPGHVADHPDQTISETRYEQFYFSDGDIIISASNADENSGSDAASAGTTLFRIDKVYLFRNILVWKDLLSGPAKPS